MIISLKVIINLDAYQYQQHYIEEFIRGNNYEKRRKSNGIKNNLSKFSFRKVVFRFVYFVLREDKGVSPALFYRLFGGRFT